MQYVLCILFILILIHYQLGLPHNEGEEKICTDFLILLEINDLRTF